MAPSPGVRGGLHCSPHAPPEDRRPDHERGAGGPRRRPPPPGGGSARGPGRPAPPLGFAGPSGVLPRSGNSPEYETVEDRWRIGFPFWDRYGQGFPSGLDYPYRLGNIENPYTQNVL